MRKIKCDDEVIVISGKDKGKRGKVVKTLGNDCLIVSGVQTVKKHQKPNPQIGQRGGIIERESPIHISNVAIFNKSTEKADKVGFKRLEGKKKIRVFKSNGEAVDAS